ncbi:hypothetical protein F4553_007562 [Allocatelliglobosispora scoriae]|uniref:Uncharacterized protein n=1 Tax=Allocatelliglobosispora scoriae TaxID=643052 RepID=A0A841C2Y5_9ACTN|nr:hypothetical protein [Allocatelliglobosispora scoriae]MBB5874128.1 hypothetical protein [Allocatelliglobosispora scoriae]
MATDIRPRDDEQYDESAAYRWTERAYELLSSGDLQGRAFAADGVLSSHVWGPCPRCGHQLDDRQVHTALVDELRWPGRRPATKGTPPPIQLPVDIACGCTHTHPHAPGDTTGCGVSFRVELTVRVTS